MSNAHTDAAAAFASSDAPAMIFMMGLPAAGKSYWRDANLTGCTIIDPDAVKETHPDYDPRNPGPLHAWSNEVCEAQFAAAIASPEGKWVVDGTGTNSDKMLRRIRQAADAGYTTHLVFVRCTLATSLRRNAARVRNVPTEIVREKARDISTAYEIVSTIAPLTSIDIVDND